MSSSASKKTGELAALIASQKNPKGFHSAFGAIKDQKTSRKWAGLAGLAEGLQHRGTNLVSVGSELPEAERETYAKNLETIFSGATKQSRDVKQSPDHRLMCLRILSH